MFWCWNVQITQSAGHFYNCWCWLLQILLRHMQRCGNLGWRPCLEVAKSKTVIVKLFIIELLCLLIDPDRPDDLSGAQCKLAFSASIFLAFLLTFISLFSLTVYLVRFKTNFKCHFLTLTYLLVQLSISIF